MPYSIAEWRQQFPVTSRLTYLNHAAVSPIAQPTLQAMQSLLHDVNQNGALHWEEWSACYQSARESAARLIGASPAEIALLKNTSEGLATIARGLDWRAGDRVVTIDSEFPANLYPWIALRDRGVKVELVAERNGRIEADDLRRHCRGARLLAISYVQYLSGFRIDLEQVGRLCADAGTLFVIDAIQGLGAFPLNVKRAGIHALAADGHKWLTGPEGAGMLFVDNSVLSQIQPREIGWMNVQAYANFEAAAESVAAADGLRWRDGASRFECGTPNTVGIYGFRAAIEFLQTVGIDVIAARILELRRYLVGRLHEVGCTVLGEFPANNLQEKHCSGIVSFRTPNSSAEETVDKLLKGGVCCAARNGWVRCSPHFYNTTGDLDRMLETVRHR